jgi:hypothetical protein
MNAATRQSVNPPDLLDIDAGTGDVQFPGSLDFFRSHEDGNYNPGGVWPGDANTNNLTLVNQTWNHSRVVVANEAYQSPGDLMRVPHYMYLHDAVNTAIAGDAFLRDMTSLNIHLQADSIIGESVVQDTALRGATIGQDDMDLAGSGNLLREAVSSMAQESVVLTVGQAEFRPIRPDLAPSSPLIPDVWDWIPNPGSSDADDLWAPATWAPVFLFQMIDGGTDYDDPTLYARSADQWPYYPTYNTGVNINGAYPAGMPRHYLFNANYMFGNAGAYYNLAIDEVADRWPLEKRVAMYVSQNRPPAPGEAPLQAPEALWIWDGEDGLENGEYMLYVGTFVPEMTNRIEEAASASAQGVDYIDPLATDLAPKTVPGLLALNSGDTTSYQLSDGTAVPMDRVTASLLRRDPTSTNPFYAGGQRFRPRYAIDVITDPSEAQGEAPVITSPPTTSEKPPGLIHPDNWTPAALYEANDDGYIFYGNNASGGWRPQVVRVTDNFLALRVRNVGTEAQLGVITHIVLAPRKRTAGRLNVNTAENRIVPKAGNTVQEFLNPLMGLPGVVDVANSVVPSLDGAAPVALPLDPLDDVTLMDSVPPTIPADGSWTDPVTLYNAWAPAIPPERNLRTADVLNPDYDLLVQSLAGTESDRHRIATYRMNAMMVTGRTEHADGRYYNSIGDLVLDSSAFDFDYVTSRADRPDFSDPTGTAQTPPGLENAAIYPLSNESVPPKRFDEVYSRFRRMGNLITTRSDVFRILMTVETGYGTDTNNDGVVNYRDHNEFTTTARSEATAIYERRTPSDESDGGE